MKRTVGAIAVIALLTTSCTSQNVWQQTADVAPVSYVAPQETLGRTVGKLRRVLVVRGKFEVREEGEVFPAKSQNMMRTVVNGSARFLREQRDYEVEILPSGGAEIPDTAATGDCAATLVEWAERSSDGVEPPSDVKSCALALSEPFNADAIVVLSGHKDWNFNARFWLTLLTASLTWPILMSQYQLGLGADMYEARTGRIVWRGRFDKSASEPLTASSGIGFLFEHLEPALPVVFIDYDQPN